MSSDQIVINGLGGAATIMAVVAMIQAAHIWALNRALEPFARIGRDLPLTANSGGEIWVVGQGFYSGQTITAGDLRRAYLWSTI